VLGSAFPDAYFVSPDGILFDEYLRGNFGIGRDQLRTPNQLSVDPDLGTISHYSGKLMSL